MDKSCQSSFGVSSLSYLTLAGTCLSSGSLASSSSICCTSEGERQARRSCRNRYKGYLEYSDFSELREISRFPFQFSNQNIEPVVTHLVTRNWLNFCSDIFYCLRNLFGGRKQIYIGLVDVNKYTGCLKKNRDLCSGVILGGYMASNQKVEWNRPPLKFNFPYWEGFSDHFVDCV